MCIRDRPSAHHVTRVSMTTTAAATAPGQAPAARPTIRYYANQLRPLRHRRRRGRQVVPWRDNPNSVLNLKEGYRKARLGVCTAITSTSKEFRCRVSTCLGFTWSLTGCFLLRLFLANTVECPGLHGRLDWRGQWSRGSS